MEQKLRILAVDDVAANRNLVGRFVGLLGHEAVLAGDGAQAVAACRTSLPDLVLMDIMMPVMDGYEATRLIRGLAGKRWLPIIFLSARGTEAEQVEGLELADDYLPKPVNLAMLAAKIRVMARIGEMQRRLGEDAERLDAYRAHNEREQRLTRQILERLIGYRERATGPVKRWIRPAQNLSGDVIAHGRSPTGAMHLMLADSTGHGLAAAIGAVPAADAFQAMTRRGYGIGAIAREINSRLHRLLPVGHFVSAVLIRVDAGHRRAEVWNGGIPAVLFVGGDGAVRAEFASRHLPLGILDESRFDAEVDTLHWDAPGEIFACSDGIIEATGAAGDPFGRQRLAATIAAAQGDRPFECVVEAVLAHLGGRDGHDDLSLAAIACTDDDWPPATKSGEAGEGEPPGDARLPFRSDEWSLSLVFSAAELRTLDPVPVLAGWFTQIGLAPRAYEELLLITTELFNNALDHGVLALDSALKQGNEGFAAYLTERRRRLGALASGRIEIRLERVRADGRPLLRLRVADSGPGFDFARRANRADGPSRASGRGLALVGRLAARLDFADHGRVAVADYLLEETHHDD